MVAPEHPYPDHQMTGWLSGRDFRPRYHGEYLASTLKVPSILRWWNGEYWSEPYNRNFSEKARQRLRRRKSRCKTEDIFFRGLKARPKVSTVTYLRPLKD